MRVIQCRKGIGDILPKRQKQSPEELKKSQAKYWGNAETNLNKEAIAGTYKLE
jgi:hypothetical protein